MVTRRDMISLAVAGLAGTALESQGAITRSALALRGAMMGGGKKIPALWIGAKPSYFDTYFYCHGKDVKVETKFYRMEVPKVGMYVVGSTLATNPSRHDACVVAGSFWYNTFGSLALNTQYTNVPFFINKINNVLWHANGLNHTASLEINGNSIASSATYSETTSSTFYIGARHHVSTIAEPCNDLGIVSVDIYDSGSLARSYRPKVIDGVAGMFDSVNDVFSPSISSTPFVYVDDIKSEGITI